MKKLCYKINNKYDYEYKELKPLEGQQKSFYGKAIIEVMANGDKVLYSYGTAVLFITHFGVFYKLWRGWSRTTANHIAAAVGRYIPKAEWDRLSLCYLTFDSISDYQGWGIFSHDMMEVK